MQKRLKLESKQDVIKVVSLVTNDEKNLPNVSSPLKCVLDGVDSPVKRIAAHMSYEESEYNRDSYFPSFMCSLFPKATILHYIFGHFSSLPYLS